MTTQDTDCFPCDICAKEWAMRSDYSCVSQASTAKTHLLKAWVRLPLCIKGGHVNKGLILIHADYMVQLLQGRVSAVCVFENCWFSQWHHLSLYGLEPGLSWAHDRHSWEGGSRGGSVMHFHHLTLWGSWEVNQSQVQVWAAIWLF